MRCWPTQCRLGQQCQCSPQVADEGLRSVKVAVASQAQADLEEQIN